MNLRFASSLVASALAAVAAGPALAQADNTNSVTEPERTIVALASPAPTETSRWSMPLWWRDEARRRELSARHAEGLTAAELGILYGTSFASGADDSAAAPTPAPAP